jgi:hypothetical protein
MKYHHILGCKNMKNHQQRNGHHFEPHRLSDSLCRQLQHSNGIITDAVDTQLGLSPMNTEEPC